MPTNIDVPALGESVTEAVLLRWLKTDGEYVRKDDPLAELETDKANVDLPAPQSGLLRRTKEPGQSVRIGETIGRIEEAAAPAKTTSARPQAAALIATAPARPASPPQAMTPPAAPPATLKPDDMRPSVRNLVAENKLDPAAIPATGPGGKLIKEDVQKFLDERKATPRPESGNGEGAGRPAVAPPASAPATPVQAPTPTPPAAAAAQPGGPLVFDESGTQRVPMSKIRKRIAINLLQAQQTAAILTTFNEVDLSAVLDLRAKYKDRFVELHGVSLGLMSFFARAVVLGLKEFPKVNAFLDGDDIVYHQYVHLGIAVSTERGLAVPVLRNVESMSFARIESEIKRLAGATRDGKLTLQELSGGTFTITNGGVFGSLLSTPIINPPQSGILGMHAIQKRPVARGDKIEIRPMMYVALSYDHRLVDGKDSVSFLVRVKEYLEDPARLMLEV